MNGKGRNLLRGVGKKKRKIKAELGPSTFQCMSALVTFGVWHKQFPVSLPCWLTQKRWLWMLPAVLVWHLKAERAALKESIPTALKDIWKMQRSVLSRAVPALNPMETWNNVSVKNAWCQCASPVLPIKLALMKDCSVDTEIKIIIVAQIFFFSVRKPPNNSFS